LVRGKKENIRREASPLFDSPLASLYKRRGKEILERVYGIINTTR